MLRRIFGKGQDFDLSTYENDLTVRQVRTAMVYAHVLNRGGKGVNNPVDDL
ncbi:MAG: hypothetical protein KKG33_14245 [candidate division Zixibacteria bacterium]|nr:hypothetical protein [candidate division Zixibacteria bacterium]MBU1471615.1 hypothetical protein [candidate division Zixibacteria bacterium]MBU2626712.1 hypothetical protein [candidate division Zixibacteria bacterium]